MLKNKDLMDDGLVMNVYEYLVEYTGNVGFPPSQAEIVERFDISRYSAVWALKELEKAGHIARKKGKPRAIKLCHYSLVESL